jgi:DNA-directed RNA polymerase subunit H (RpoH/RPB5)
LGVDSVLEQIEISNSQIPKPLQIQQKSVLEQIEISNSQIPKPLQIQPTFRTLNCHTTKIGRLEIWF